jgi:hypothetical protein
MSNRERILASLLLLSLSLVLSGCGQSEVPVDSTWCEERGVPALLCPHCRPELEEKYRATGDWCDMHQRPASQCFECNPHLAAGFEKLRPK